MVTFPENRNCMSPCLTPSLHLLLEFKKDFVEKKIIRCIKLAYRPAQIKYNLCKCSCLF